jgi:hypothetical protein
MGSGGDPGFPASSGGVQLPCVWDAATQKIAVIY